MATKAQVLRKIESKLIQVHQSELVWADIVSAIGGASIADKTLIVQAIKTKDEVSLAKIIFSLVGNKVITDAKAEAASMTADDNLSLTELMRIF